MGLCIRHLLENQLTTQDQIVKMKTFTWVICSFLILVLLATVFVPSSAKVHGSLARAGKVKGQTPKVDPEEKKKKKTGRAARRAQYNRRFVTTNSAFGGKKKGPNCQADRVNK